MTAQDTLRAQLKAALDSKDPNAGELLALASQMAAADPNEVRFSVDAGLINRLGLQLVARQETAVAELVKNAFDADATYVKLIFSEHANRPGGRLIVEDNGNGMTREQLVNGFMRLASDEKVREPRSPRFLRQRAGRKGIGRFAAQRLGEQLTLVTQCRDADHALEVQIDWRRFDRAGELSAIALQIRSVAKQQEHGTKLIIDRLREAWSEKQIRRVYQYVTELQQPFPLAPPEVLDPAPEDRADPGFKAEFYRAQGGGLIAVADEDTMLFSHAAAEVKGEVDALGYGTWSVKSERLNFEDSGEVSADDEQAGQPFQHLRSVRFHAYNFIWTEEFVPGQERTRLLELAQQKGGIRLFRNGFRVLPFGARDDDWLGLDEEYSRRGVLVPIRNINWFGFVEVRDPDGILFQETSSREGLVQTPAFQELVRFVPQALISAAKRVGAARNKKTKAGKTKKKTPDEQLRLAAEDLEKAADLTERGKANAAYSAAVFRQTAGIIRQAATESEELLGELGLLRVLASVGQAIGIFTHEVRHRLVDIEASAHRAALALDAKHPAHAGMTAFRDHVALLRAYTAYFDATISSSVQRGRLPQDLSFILHDFIRDFRPVAERSSVTFVEPQIQEHVLHTAPMHASEWASVLMNLFTNSLKAIRRGPHRGNGQIFIRAWREGDRLYVDFADNGDGIPEEHAERVFDPFFTTTAAPSEANSEVGGTGLGLKIVRDILTAAGGDIDLTSPPEGYSTAFRLEVPAERETAS